MENGGLYPLACDTEGGRGGGGDTLKSSFSGGKGSAKRTLHRAHTQQHRLGAGAEAKKSAAEAHSRRPRACGAGSRGRRVALATGRPGPAHSPPRPPRIPAAPCRAGGTGGRHGTALPAAGRAWNPRSSRGTGLEAPLRPRPRRAHGRSHVAPPDPRSGGSVASPRERRTCARRAARRLLAARPSPQRGLALRRHRCEGESTHR